MSEEFQIKGKIVVDASDLEQLPTKAANAAKGAQQKLSAVGAAVGSTKSDAEEKRLAKNETLRAWRAANPERSAQYMRDWRARQKGVTGGDEGAAAAPGALAAKIASMAATKTPSAANNQALASALGKAFAPGTGAALSSLTPSATAIAAQQSGLGAALAAANAGQLGGGGGGRRRPPPGVGRAGPRGGGPGQPPRPRAYRQPASSQSRSGSIGAGLFRGLATTFSQGTGINIPFLALNPSFIAGAAAASAFSLAVKAAFSTTIELGHAVMELRVAMGGGVSTVARFAAVAQNSNVPVGNLTKSVGSMEQTITKDPAAFARLGIALNDASGKAKPLSTILDEARGKISAIKDPSLQASAALSLFGDSYVGILPMLRQTNAQLLQQAPDLKAQAASIMEIQKQTAQWDANTSKFGTTMSRVGQTIATPFIAVVNAIGASSEDAGKAQEFYAKTWNDTYDAAVKAGKVAQVARNEADAARKQAILNYVAPSAAALQPAEAVKGPDIALLKESASVSISALQESISLDQSLRDIDQSRAQLAFQIATAETNLYNMQFDQQQALANQAEDRAMQLAEQVAALTISLNEFKAAEQSAAIRAREQEKSFFAFRPDNALVRADQERRYSRDREQEIARNARTNALAERQLSNQKLLAGLDNARMDREQVLIDQQKAVHVLTHDDVQKNADTAVTQLAAAVIGLKNSGTGTNPAVFDVTFNFPKTGNAMIDAMFATYLSGITTDAINIIRGQGNRGDRVGRIGGNQIP